jgi:hypothetical protein
MAFLPYLHWLEEEKRESALGKSETGRKRSITRSGGRAAKP